MDADTLKTLIALGEHGGSVAMFIAIFIAGRASKVAAEAVENLKAIRAGLETGFKELSAAAKESDEKLDRIHVDIQTMPLRVIRAGNGRAP